MINIRTNCFETNSSSTHCLVIRDEQFDTPSKDIFTKEYIVYPFTSTVYDATYTTVEDKLRYFLTLYYMGDDYHTEIMNMLAEMFPNALFIKHFEKGYSPYVFEDGDCYQDNLNITYEELKEFMLNGVVYFGDRNNEQFSDMLDNIKYSSTHKFFCRWSG